MWGRVLGPQLKSGKLMSTSYLSVNLLWEFPNPH